MTESGNSRTQDDSDEDIYKDILEFNLEDELAKLEGNKETLKQETNDLSEKVNALTEENKELKKSNEVLKKNLSTLLKTAQAEVQRKDSMIQELRTQVDSFTFRRNKTSTKEKYTSTEDLDFNTESQFETEKQMSNNDRIKSKTHESRTNSESERRSIHEEEKRKELSGRQEENLDCDNNRKSNYRGNSKTDFRHSGSSQDRERYRERKSSRHEDNSGRRRPYRENHRDHLKYDSFDKKRHSRSSDNRFLPRRRNSRERRSDRRRDDSSERSRRKNSKKDRSRSREFLRGSKESSLEKPKTRSSLDKDSGVRIREKSNTKAEVSDSGRNGTDVGDCKKRKSSEDKATTGSKSKEKRSGKPEKRGGLDAFTAKSPLDALYNDLISSRNSNRFGTAKTAKTQRESDLEEGELSTTPTPTPTKSEPEEDWTLSFKNERPKDSKPMTLYSRRMMRKFSSELKNKEEKEPEATKEEVVQKETGEFTDDENIIESSKEFQELAKAASIESEIIEKERDFAQADNSEERTDKQNPKELEKPPKEESTGNQVELKKDTHEIIEFSPFKNNYKLIEISPIKPSNAEHVLDFYNQRPPQNQPQDQNAVNLSDSKSSSDNSTLKTSDTSGEWKNSSVEKESDAELKNIPPAPESPEDDKKPEKKELKKSKRIEDDVCKEETNAGKRKQRSASNQESLAEKSQKRKRKSSESDVGKMDVKKRKIIDEPSRKSPRMKRISKSEPDPQPEPVPETKKIDISSSEFFKPASKTPIDIDKVISTTTDHKMTATMSVTGVIRLETPNKCVEKLKNLMINEHIFNVLDPKNSSQFSPLIGTKYIEMTPGRMLKNDLMLTDSEDDSLSKRNEDEVEEEALQEEAEEEEDEMSGSEYSECDSDSGASNFVDLL